MSVLFCKSVWFKASLTLVTHLPRPSQEPCIKFQVRRRHMRYRSLRIPMWLITAAFFATVVASSAGRAALPNAQPAFRIVTPDISAVMTQDVTPEIAQTLQMDQAQGVVISHVTPSPLREGDVILSINDHPVACQGELDLQ